MQYNQYITDFYEKYSNTDTKKFPYYRFPVFCHLFTCIRHVSTIPDTAPSKKPVRPTIKINIPSILPGIIPIYKIVYSKTQLFIQYLSKIYIMVNITRIWSLLSSTTERMRCRSDTCSRSAKPESRKGAHRDFPCRPGALGSLSR